MRIKLEKERRADIIEALISFHSSEFDEDISEFRAAEIVDFLLQKIGPSQYNQGISDARKYLAEKLDDLDTEFYAPED
jgi:uncharacterized protein (DUF2164 family)